MQPFIGAFGLIFIFVCTVICAISTVFNFSVLKANGRLRVIVKRLKLIIDRVLYWYAQLYEWVVEQGRMPPTPEPKHVAETPTPHEKLG